MAHLFRMEEWEANGKWHCADTTDLANGSASWWIPCRVLDITPAAFVKMLVEEYHATVDWRAEKGLLFVSWEKQSDMRKYKNKINKIAREKVFFI